MRFGLARFLLFRMDPEDAHGLTIRLLQRLPAASAVPADPILAQSLMGLDFPGPVGLAPGFDKNAQIFSRMGRFGFGFAEVGTLTPLPQAGNPRPRLFRLVADGAVINRMGFNNDGLEAALARIGGQSRRTIVLGINVGANKDSADRVADYVTGIRRAAPLADYLTVNISSPNTPGLRALQDRGALDALLEAVMEARGSDGPPVWLKVAPDLSPEDVADIADIVLARHIDALVVSNTTIARPATLRSAQAGEAGGLSGAPLRDMAQARLMDFRRATGGAIPLIGVGGISNADDAYMRIRAGASLVQIYSAMVYHGPYLARAINHGVAQRLRRDGFASITEATGVDCPL